MGGPLPALLVDCVESVRRFRLGVVFSLSGDGSTTRRAGATIQDRSTTSPSRSGEGSKPVSLTHNYGCVVSIPVQPAVLTGEERLWGVQQMNGDFMPTGRAAGIRV